MNTNKKLVNAFNHVFYSDNFYEDFCVVSVSVEKDFLENPVVSIASIISGEELKRKLEILKRKYPFLLSDFKNDKNASLHPRLFEFMLFFDVNRINLENKSLYTKFDTEMEKRFSSEEGMIAFMNPLNKEYDDCGEVTLIEDDIECASMIYLNVNDITGELIRICSPCLTLSCELCVENLLKELINAVYDSPISFFFEGNSNSSLIVSAENIKWEYEIPMNVSRKELYRKFRADTWEHVYDIYTGIESHLADISRECFSMRISEKEFKISFVFSLCDEYLDDNIAVYFDEFSDYTWVV